MFSGVSPFLFGERDQMTNSYTIGNVHYENFGPFEDATVDFSEPGITVIEGNIVGKRGCCSNGSGKSFLMDGVAWALYGRCIRERYDGDKVIRLDSSGGTCVTVELKGIDTVSIRRYRKHPLHKDSVVLLVKGHDVSRGTTAQTTLAIENLIGIDFTSFLNSVAFGVREDIKSFFSAPDSERKQILEKLLGLELYSEAEKVARRRLREFATKLEEFTTRRTELQAIISEREALLKGFAESDSKEELEKKVNTAVTSLKDFNKRIVLVQQRLGLLDESIADKETAAQAKIKQHDQNHAEYTGKKTNLERAQRNAENEVATIQGQQKLIDMRKDKIKKLSGVACPTCSQPVSKAQTDAMLKSTDAEMKIRISKRLTFEMVIDQSKANLSDLVEPTEPSFPELESLNTQKENEQKKFSELSSARNIEGARLTEMKAELGRIENQATEMRASISDAKEELVETDKKYAVLQAKADRIQFWVEGFGNQGLKSFLIEAEVPSINRLATSYARRLLGDGATVCISPTKELKTKGVIREELTVEGIIPGCTNTYAGASKGQKHRLDLCLVLAFRDIVSSRSVKAFKQMFLDELFDGLDKSGCETVVELLKELSHDCPVIMVTHDQRIKPAGNRFIMVHHEKGKAKILARGAQSATVIVGRPQKKSV